MKKKIFFVAFIISTIFVALNFITPSVNTFTEDGIGKLLFLVSYGIILIGIIIFLAFLVSSPSESDINAANKGK